RAYDAMVRQEPHPPKQSIPSNPSQAIHPKQCVPSNPSQAIHWLGNALHTISPGMVASRYVVDILTIESHQ
ncbi:MAG: hypothetical protein ACOVLE_12375, partial [Pirellula staleyi]